MLREKHDFWCLAVCILVFVVISRDKPYQSGQGFGVMARVPFSDISGKLKKHDWKFPYEKPCFGTQFSQLK